MLTEHGQEAELSANGKITSGTFCAGVSELCPPWRSVILLMFEKQSKQTVLQGETPNRAP